jgi:hypothetical protein
VRVASKSSSLLDVARSVREGNLAESEEKSKMIFENFLLFQKLATLDESYESTNTLLRVRWRVSLRMDRSG